jgi:uncharacterized protein YecT (DUF1311 family)
LEKQERHSLAVNKSIRRKGRPGIRVLVFMLAAFPVSSPLLAANDAILPDDWSPSVTDTVDYLQNELEQEQAQQGINRLTAQISNLLDTELFIAYVRLFDHLDPRAQATLKRDQSDWLKQRMKAALLAAKKEEGGSASPMESNYAFAEFTRKRIQLLNDRLKRLGIEISK